MAEAGEPPSEPEVTGSGKFKQIMGMGTVQVLAIWLIIYEGVEVSLGGWIVTFIEQKRGGGATAGYISSGFFAGRLCCCLLNASRNLSIQRHDAGKGNTALAESQGQ